MDILNHARIVLTVVTFATFLGIAFWAYSGRRKVEFERAARMVLDDEDIFAESAAPESMVRIAGGRGE
ncbi:MAG TPA: cbb3-type cytochrome c oxidase subunit 3 [Burkholderiales bacterium]|nr:cbb3-type cytochrome c oxidase subunit 3 [Burkholderiales bacterium]